MDRTTLTAAVLTVLAGIGLLEFHGVPVLRIVAYIHGQTLATCDDWPPEKVQRIVSDYWDATGRRPIPPMLSGYTGYELDGPPRYRGQGGPVLWTQHVTVHRAGHPSEDWWAMVGCGGGIEHSILTRGGVSTAGGGASK